MIIKNEIDHRIKNSLNLISSILGLQILNLKNGSHESPQEILKKSKSRIDALIMIYDTLFLSKDKGEIDFSVYVETLSEKVSKTFHKKILLKIYAIKIKFSLEIMIELGIILNELFINSIKHGTRTVEIHLTKTSRHCILIYLEKGNKAADLHKIKESKKLGIKLIELMIKQLRAVMKIKRNGDLGYTIKFKCQDTRYITAPTNILKR